MLDRIVLLFAIAILITVVVVVVRTWSARKAHAVKDNAPAWDALGAQPDGRRTLIAFSTPSCAACHKAQAPAIDLATRQLGADQVRLIKVDAAEQPEAARAFGILTVPSTVILGAKGKQIVAINQGFTPSARLVEQLQSA